MAVEKTAVRNQVSLFGLTLDSLVPEGHVARLIGMFVSDLDLKALGFSRRGRSERGAPSYAAELLLGAWIYGYFKHIRSSRGLERACHDDVGLIWLTGHQPPDHNTLWRFWRDNGVAIGKLFKATAMVAHECGLVGMELVAVDGTKVQTCGGMRLGHSEKSLAKYAARLDREVAELERQIEAAGASLPAGGPDTDLRLELADKEFIRSKVAAAQAELKRSDLKAMIPHEPEARVMHTTHGQMMCYNAQGVADRKCGVLVAAALTNEANDSQQLTPMIGKVEQTMGQVADLALADTGYNVLAEFGKAEVAGYNVLVNSRTNGEDKGIEVQGPVPPKAHDFIYDKEADTVTCPVQGTQLLASGKPKPTKNKKAMRQVFRCKNLDCPLRAACSKDKNGRSVEITPNHHLRAENRARGQTPEGKALLAQRKTIIEPVFGQIKHNGGFRKFSFMGLKKAEVQWLFICALHNLRKIFKAKTAATRLQA